jgi:hypothetical protein
MSTCLVLNTCDRGTLVPKRQWSSNYIQHNRKFIYDVLRKMRNKNKEKAGQELVMEFNTEHLHNMSISIEDYRKLPVTSVTPSTTATSNLLKVPLRA